MLDKQGYMHAHACTRPHILAQARKPTQTHKCIVQWLRERATTLRYAYIACLVKTVSSNMDITACLFLFHLCIKRTPSLLQVLVLLIGYIV